MYSLCIWCCNRTRKVLGSAGTQAVAVMRPHADLVIYYCCYTDKPVRLGTASYLTKYNRYNNKLHSQPSYESYFVDVQLVRQSQISSLVAVWSSLGYVPSQTINLTRLYQLRVRFCGNNNIGRLPWKLDLSSAVPTDMRLSVLFRIKIKASHSNNCQFVNFEQSLKYAVVFCQ